MIDKLPSTYNPRQPFSSISATFTMPQSLFHLPLALLLLLTPEITSASAPSSPSPPGSSSLICHTNNPLECYPRIFQPTADFQIVHDDQSLPPGLLIRLTSAT